MPEKIIVTFQPYGKRVEAPIGATILEIARMAGVSIRSICGGKGQCGKCRVIVQRGLVEFRQEEEEFLTHEELARGYVLACLARCLSDCEILIPPESRIEGQRIQREVALPKVTPHPAVVKVLVPSFISDADRIKERLERESGVRVPYSAVEKILEALMDYEDSVTVVMSRLNREAKVMHVERGDTTNRAYGLAVDIGTTKIVAYLVDLNTGEILGSEADYNAQLAYGEDLISRISYAVENECGLSRLQEAAVSTINSLVDRLTAKYGVSHTEIYDVCVAGNTVMTYFFVGRDPAPLLDVGASVPKEAFKLEARKVGLKVNASARVYCLPCVSRFFGGDAIGDILVSGMYESPDIALLIDVGTNVEAVLGCKDWYLATTAAAGPAFEGWGVKFGLRAIEGAIDSVKIDPVTLKAKYTVIGGGKPKGICGSGLIDLLAEMFRHGIIDSLGKISRKLDSPYIREGEQGREYVVVPKEESGIGMDIVITEKDIANLIDSKSAACAAIAVLLKKMKLSVSDIRKVYICGAFGSYIDPNSAMAIGLLPELPNAEIVYLGNGSVGGAYLTLMSTGHRKVAEDIAHTVAYFELLKDADFMDEYLAGFVLPGKKELFPTWWEASRKGRTGG